MREEDGEVVRGKDVTLSSAPGDITRSHVVLSLARCQGPYPSFLGVTADETKVAGVGRHIFLCPQTRHPRIIG